MKPDPDDILVYEHFRQAHGWPPSVVDAQDAVFIQKFLVMDRHRDKIAKSKKGKQ